MTYDEIIPIVMEKRGKSRPWLAGCLFNRKQFNQPYQKLYRHERLQHELPYKVAEWLAHFLCIPTPSVLHGNRREIDMKMKQDGERMIFEHSSFIALHRDRETYVVYTDGSGRYKRLETPLDFPLAQWRIAVADPSVTSIVAKEDDAAAMEAAYARRKAREAQGLDPNDLDDDII